MSGHQNKIECSGELFPMIAVQTSNLFAAIIASNPSTPGRTIFSNRGHPRSTTSKNADEASVAPLIRSDHSPGQWHRSLPTRRRREYPRNSPFEPGTARAKSRRQSSSTDSSTVSSKFYNQEHRVRARITGADARRELLACASG
ncbi:hypothetical protein BC936DRAFT_137666 [Jimgerdemannia flammicorona]|uniref:Uncharacterized protein n=1 Tax=Jimgerdemannia flammicorona TaxID=994334 RepID=A0A433DIV5_9FUNG|nr:hypothetical protein BC936DRAFT_137666 [Jimgerdemannia flammicorona]